MHFISSPTGGFTAYAVTGINTVSFAIDFEQAACDGLLGFAVEREDPLEAERYYMPGFKVFAGVMAQPGPDFAVSTFDQPVQSFVWDDFTAKPGRRYTYWFHPMRGKPKALDRSSPPIAITVETEPLFTTGPQDVFFNRGVASSQAYARRFGNLAPDQQPTRAKQQEALDWLSRNLDDAILAFIRQAQPGDSLLGCFYEFHYPPVLEALKSALDQGVAVRLILDGKDNSSTDAKGVFHEAFPRMVNRAAVAAAGLDPAVALWRQNNRNDIQHNKFMVLLQGAAQTPAQVWTGSTNLSMGGIHGQTNVGHWVRDGGLASDFARYWQVLLDDPGATPGDNRADALRHAAACRQSVMDLRAVPERWQDIPQGVTAVFSPRKGSAVLDMYAQTLDEAEKVGCVTLAFGINKDFKAALADNSADNAVTFLLLESRDRPNPKAKTPFVALGPAQNVYQAWGAFLSDPLYQWTRETNALRLRLNTHVGYVHSKFMLKDPLSADPLVISGSANFSDASTNDNDENMILIRGDARVADICFTEFNRLFNHYYFRSVQEATSGPKAQTSDGSAANGAADASASLLLDETPGWLAKYQPGHLRRKRLEIFTAMANPIRL